MNDPNKSDPVKRKDFQLTGDNDKTPNKLAEGHNHESNSEDSPSNLLPDIKQFNIEKSKYRHYGKQSSMNAQSLQKIINSEAGYKVDKKHEDIHDHIYEKLGLSRSEFFSLSNETISELLKYKTEQEKTKQEEIRNEFASTTLQLLTLAKSMDFNPDLIPYLFNNSSFDVKKNLELLNSNPNLTPNEIFANFESRKRSYSDTVKLENAHKSTSTLVSPTRSPPPQRSADISPQIRSPQQRSPSPSGHRRNKSEDSGNVTSNAASNVPSPSSNYPNYEPYSQQHSPNIVSQSYQGPPPGMYPVYYHPGPPPHHQPQVAATSHPQTPSEQAQATQSQGPNQPVTSQPSNQGQQQGSKSLGSPYQQKYPILYPPRGSYPPPPGYVPQQYHYYVPTSQPAGSGQYNGSMVPPFAPYTSMPSESKEILDEPSSHKRQKSNISKNNINFMISTPKNPPARKYNNPKEK